MDLLLDDERLGVRVGATTAADGDVHPTRVDAEILARRQVGLAGARWAMAEHVHGTEIWSVDSVRSSVTLVPADIVVLERARSRSGSPSPSAVAVWAADCATVFFVTGNSLVGVHAGWRGLAAGVIQRAAAIAVGAGPIESVVVGPLIGPCCYEFSDCDVAAVAAGVGAATAAIQGVTGAGALALDTGAAVCSALAEVGITPDAAAQGCTGCTDDGRRWFSHRARVDVRRQALVGWFV